MGVTQNMRKKQQLPLSTSIRAAKHLQDVIEQKIYIMDVAPTHLW